MTELPHSTSALEKTRRSLHGIAEMVMAGPQYAASNDIRLRVVDGAITTWTPVLPLRLEASVLATPTGTLQLRGSFSELASAAGLAVRELTDVYSGGPGISPDEQITIDAAAADELLSAFVIGDRALADFAPDDERVLWPEHFDIGISQDEVNFGVSPGDSHVGVPYAYVGPWKARVGAFWNMSFGATRTIAELGDAAAVGDFFRQGRVHASQDSLA